MTEDRLQYECVTWFHNALPQERGYLCRTENKTNKGARDLGLGMVRGMSDLKYTAPCETQVLFELKVNGSKHEVKTLKSQLEFIKNHEKRGAVGFFVFSKDHFQTIIANIVQNGLNITALTMANHSCDYIRMVIDQADAIGNKTVHLFYDFKEQ